jgi:exopolysaccharide biosynthesis polyprenyl glycosylphosphotransferase
MMNSDFWHNIPNNFLLSQEKAGAHSSHSWRHTTKIWIIADILTVLTSVMLALVLDRHIGNVVGVKEFFPGTLIHGRLLVEVITLLTGFIITLVGVSRQLHLYTPRRFATVLQEQSASVRACFTSALLLTGALYLIHAQYVPRTVVLITVVLVTVALCLRRLIYRLMLYRRLERGLGTRDVLIVGTGPAAQALRRQLEAIRHLGYTFKGFIRCEEDGDSTVPESSDVIGTSDTLFQQARLHFVDEIFITTTPRKRGAINEMLEQARAAGADVRVIPEMYDGLAWGNPIEYVGQFPSIPLHCQDVPEIALLLKRIMDVVFTVIALIVFAPLVVAIAIAIKLDSPGPVFYCSERIGKKARVFPCMKFRTMVPNADKLRESMMHLNERSDVLFKVSNDPRITKVGRLLRKYSLDEMPQLFNVLRGDMSIVGPRPPIASEVREYKLNHLRRLDVTPGITGLWQVVGRQDPSFESYISLDVAYIENWSIWLDLVLMLRTVGVILAGTGS